MKVTQPLGREGVTASGEFCAQMAKVIESIQVGLIAHCHYSIADKTVPVTGRL